MSMVPQDGTLRAEVSQDGVPIAVADAVDRIDVCAEKVDGSVKACLYLGADGNVEFRLSRGGLLVEEKSFPVSPAVAATPP